LGGGVLGGYKLYFANLFFFSEKLLSLPKFIFRKYLQFENICLLVSPVVEGGMEMGMKNI
jgi:hypothetical protein